MKQMTDLCRQRANERSRLCERQDGGAHRICVGDLLQDCEVSQITRLTPGVESVAWHELAMRIADGVPPDTIYSAAVSSNFDCIDIAQLLYRVGFVGQYRVIAPDVPNPGLIRREVLALCPGLDFQIGADLPGSLIRAS